MKTCSICHQEKPDDAFAKEGTRRRGQCKACRAASARSWRSRNQARAISNSRRYYKENSARIIVQSIKRNKENPEKTKRYRRNHHLKKRYGITDAQYQEMLVRQHGGCAICGEAASLCVDHDHATGHVRGLLCTNHNLAIGLLGDNLEYLSRAIAYLQGKLR